ncbi:MAG TPA: c-type cytochrome [Arsenicitalea sp.]|jgi:cytochrome c|nr:c-type cytochrome [Arsenicitalea sp.]
MKYAQVFVAAAILATGALGSTAAFAADGDPVAGKAIFTKNCSVCHEAEKQRHGGGPYLMGVVGRPAASTDFPRYSKAMKASGIVWDTAKIATFIYEPKAYVPGTAMYFAGLKDTQAAADVAAYLAEHSPAPAK